MTRSRSHSQKRKQKDRKNQVKEHNHIHKHKHKKVKHRQISLSKKIKRDCSDKHEKIINELHKDELHIECPGDLKVEDSPGSKCDDAEHYSFTLGQRFNNDKYEVTKFLCDGTFGRVVEVRHTKDNKLYAMKIIRAVERYVQSAKAEGYILQYLEARDQNKDSKIVQFYEAFHRKQNYCMIFERLGLSLYEILKKNEFVGFPIKMVQSFFKQLLKSIMFMHSLHITHTDLKPENILVCSTELIKTKVRVNRSSSNATTECSEAEENYKKIYLPVTDEIKLIDMGGATFDYEPHCAIINTRQYRSPEVILGCCKWDSSSDIWAIACIVIELLTGIKNIIASKGELFFLTRKSDLEHLAMIEKACGAIPHWMVQKTGPPFDKHFDVDWKVFSRNNSYYIWPQTSASDENRHKINNMKLIEELINYPQLADLLKKMLKIDPQHRINCSQSLAHPFFNEKFE